MFPLDILLLLGGAFGSPIEASDYESGILDGSTWDIVQSYEEAKARILEDRLAGVTRHSPVGPGLMTESPLMAEGLVELSGSGAETEESGSLGHPGHFLATDDLVSFLNTQFLSACYVQGMITTSTFSCRKTSPFCSVKKRKMANYGLRMSMEFA